MASQGVCWYSVCNVEVENADGAGQGYDGPCTYDEGPRTLAFGDADTVIYSAVLSAC